MKDPCAVINVCAVMNLPVNADIPREAREDSSAVTTNLKLFPAKLLKS